MHCRIKRYFKRSCIHTYHSSIFRDDTENIPLMQKLVAFDQKDAAYLNVCEIIIIYRVSYLRKCVVCLKLCDNMIFTFQGVNGDLEANVWDETTFSNYCDNHKGKQSSECHLCTKKVLNASKGDISPAVKRKKLSYLSDSTRKPQIVERMVNIIEANPGTSMKDIIRELPLPEGTIRNLLYMRAFGRNNSWSRKDSSCRHTRTTVASSKSITENLRSWNIHHENNFSPDLKVNRGNDSWFCLVRSNLSNFTRILNGGFGWLPGCWKLLWIPGYILHAIGGTLHRLRKLRWPNIDWRLSLHLHIAPNIWPHDSPDINPLDYYKWSFVEVGRLISVSTILTGI